MLSILTAKNEEVNPRPKKYKVCETTNHRKPPQLTIPSPFKSQRKSPQTAKNQPKPGSNDSKATQHNRQKTSPLYLRKLHIDISKIQNQQYFNQGAGNGNQTLKKVLSCNTRQLTPSYEYGVQQLSCKNDSQNVLPQHERPSLQSTQNKILLNISSRPTPKSCKSPAGNEHKYFQSEKKLKPKK